MEFEEQSSRKRFLKQVGIALAVGVGAAALPSRARATEQDNGQCCLNDSRCPSGGCGNNKNYWCDCLSYSYCTGCRTPNGTCYLAPC